MSATSLDLSQIKTDALSAASSFRTLIGLGSGNTPTFLGATLTGGTVTASAPLIDATQTWNSAGTVFTGMRLNVTDTASSSSSLLMDLQVGGSSRFRVQKNGDVNFGALSLLKQVGDTTNTGFKFENGYVRMYSNGSNLLIFSTGSTASDAVQFIGASGGQWTFGNDGSHILPMRNGTNAQTFRIYNTFTDASNYERGKLEWASNEFRIGTEAAGTGTVRTIRLQAGTATAFYFEPVYGNIGIGTTGYGSTVYLGTIAIGTNALSDTTANNGNYIVAIGTAALRYLNVANSTTEAVAVGSQSGGRLRAAAASVLVGGYAGRGASSFTAQITNTTCLGFEAGAGFDSTTITDNTCIGYRAGFALTTGSNNTLLGSLAGDSITTGANNIAIGRDCDVDSATASNQINIGNQYYHNRAFLYNTFTSATNYERLKLEWASNVLQLGTEKGSAGGSARALELQTDGTTRLTIGTTGISAFAGQVTFPTGTNATPSILHAGTAAGIAFEDTNQFYFVIAGQYAMRMTRGGVITIRSDTTIGWSSGAANVPADLILARDSAQTLAQRNAGNAQRFNLYGTFTDASNYRRLYLNSTTAGAFTLGVEGAGTGASGNTLELQTDGTTRLAIGTDGRLAAQVGGAFPQYTGIGNTGNGVRVAADRVDFWVGGSVIAVFQAGSFLLGSNALNWSSNTQLFGNNDGTGRLVLRNATSPQTFSIANTYTSFSNKEELQIGWVGNSSVAKIETIKGTGGGVARSLEFGTDGTTRLTIGATGLFTIADALNIEVGTTTGTKIGTATTQKIGFYDATPVVRPTAVADATDAASVITQLNALLSRMRTLGLIAT